MKTALLAPQASDIYVFGVVLLELLSGRAPPAARGLGVRTAVDFTPPVL